MTCSHDSAATAYRSSVDHVILWFIRMQADCRPCDGQFPLVYLILLGSGHVHIFML